MPRIPLDQGLRAVIDRYLDVVVAQDAAPQPLINTLLAETAHLLGIWIESEALDAEKTAALVGQTTDLLRTLVGNFLEYVEYCPPLA